MPLTAKVINLSKAQARLRAVGTVLQRPLRDVLDSGARVAAISCANTSQPFGTGQASLSKGTGRVGGDIGNVYQTAGNAWKTIRNRRYASLFWLAYKAGEYDVAQNFLDAGSSSLAGVPIGSFDGGSAHKSARNDTTGRVQISRPALIVTNWSALKSYVAKRKKNVGFGKGGWADAARRISGSIRGLRTKGDITANWITRQASGLGRITRSGSDSQPLVTIRSSVRYASQILQGSAKSEAIRIARDLSIKNLLTAVRAETRKLRKAA